MKTLSAVAVAAAVLGGAGMVAALAGTGSAAAETGVPQTYSDVSSALSSAGLRGVVASVEGHALDVGDCIVERSQSAPWNRSGSVAPVTVLLYLNCS